MVSNIMWALGLLGSTAVPANAPVLKVHCGVFDRCGWHRVDKATHPIVAGVTHVVNQAGQLVNKSDKGVNDWWEHVKHDTGPAINEGAIHFVVTTVTAINNSLYHPCPSGTDTTYTDVNGNTIHKCKGATDGPPLEPTVPNQGVEGEKDGDPVQVVTVDGPYIFPKYCSRVPFEMTIEIYDITAQQWTQNIHLPPDGCATFGIRPDADNKGYIYMRFYYHNSQEVRVQFLHDGEEFTV